MASSNVGRAQKPSLLRAAQRSQTPRGPRSNKTEQTTTRVAAAHFSRRPPPRGTSAERKSPSSESSDGSSPYKFDQLKEALAAKKHNSRTQPLGRVRSSSLGKIEAEQALNPSQQACRTLYYATIKEERADFKTSLASGCPLEYPFFRKFAEEQGMEDLPEILTKDNVLLLKDQFPDSIEQIYDLYKRKLESEYDVHLERLGIFFDKNIQIDTLELTIQAVSNLKLVADRLYDKFHEIVEPELQYFEASSIPSKVYYATKLINNDMWLNTTQALDFSNLGITRLPLNLHLLKFEHLLHIDFEGNLLSEIPENWFRQAFSNMLTMNLAYNRFKIVAWDFGAYFTNKLKKVSLAHQKIAEPIQNFPFHNFNDRAKTFTLDLTDTPVHRCLDPETVPYTLLVTPAA